MDSLWILCIFLLAFQNQCGSKCCAAVGTCHERGMGDAGKDFNDCDCRQAPQPLVPEGNENERTQPYPFAPYPVLRDEI